MRDYPLLAGAYGDLFKLRGKLEKDLNKLEISRTRTSDEEDRTEQKDECTMRSVRYVYVYVSLHSQWNLSLK
jgi:hypothetical protein